MTIFLWRTGCDAGHLNLDNIDKTDHDTVLFGRIQTRAARRKHGVGPMKAEDYINRKALSERLDGDFDLFKELAQLFLSDSPKLVSAIEEAISNKNGEKIGKSSHTIKGAVANFSAEKAYAAALELEKIGKNHELDKADDAFRKLMGEIDNMRTALQMMIKESRL